MIADLKSDGFHVSLWQLPYFVPKNRLFPEILEKGLFVHDGKGRLPYEDAVLDFSNPDAVKWYREKIAGLLRLGVGAIKVDFGEAAPLTGIYALRPQRLLRAQPLSAALQQGRRRGHARRSPATTSSGPAAPGRAASAIPSTGAATRARWTSAWPPRCAADSPSASPASRSGATTSAASWATRPRTSITAGCPSGCSPRTAAATARRPRSRGSSAPASSTTIAARRR